MLNKRVLAAMIFSLFAISACSTSLKTKEVWTDFSSHSAIKDLGTDAGIVIYRGENGSENRAVNIAINGEYQASLLRKGYTELAVCAQPQRVGAFLTGTDAAYVRKHNSGQYVQLSSGKKSYFRVDVNGENASLNEVDESTAINEMNGVQYQAHTLSRVNKNNTCGEHKYILNADVLFAFKQSSVSSILQNGYDEIKDVSEDIKRYPNKIKQIEVIGHTDPLGSEVYNRQLSYQRAQSVKTLLIKNGINSNIISVKGNGSANLIVKDCSVKYHNNPELLKSCNQPNRHVEIKIHTL